MATHRLRPTAWALGTSVAAVLLGLLLAAFVGRGEGDGAEPRELYAAVSAHLAACRAENYGLAYHAAASTVQDHLSAGQFERKLRADYGPVRRADHVEFGPVRVRRGGEPARAELEVYFVLDRRGEVIVRRFELVREDDGWKVDRSDPVAGQGAGARVRLTGPRV